MADYAILCVDDERTVLQSLQATLGREFGRDYMIEIAQSGEEALDLIRELQEDQVEVPVLITDQIMPGMKGSDLLFNVKQQTPETLSILLTGQSGADEVGDAVNRGNLYRFIPKPWERADLLLTVQEALRSYRQQQEIEEKNRQLKNYAEHLEDMVAKRTAELELERDKSERLLLNILPKQTAAELKETGLSTPRGYRQVSIVFTDFVGFSVIASQVTPADLVETLSECFNAFDNITAAYNLEKIKTIGDSYMAAGGIPQSNTSNPEDAVRAALAMRNWVDAWNVRREAAGLIHWKMRTGVHTGELVAGVIGNKKFAYDVWGDSVNVASRMEAYGEPGKVNVSEVTRGLLNGAFAFEDRGEIEIKHGRQMKMFFVEEAGG